MIFPARVLENRVVCSFVGHTNIVEKCGIRLHSEIMKFANVVDLPTWRLVLNRVLRYRPS